MENFIFCVVHKTENTLPIKLKQYKTALCYLDKVQLISNEDVTTRQNKHQTRKTIIHIYIFS